VKMIMNYIFKITLTIILLSFFNPISFNAYSQDYAVNPLDQWHLRNPSVPHLLAVTSGNGIYVAVGDIGTLVTSRDGINWTRQNAGTDLLLHGVAYGNGLFVAVGGDKNNYGYYTSVILSSTDGINWTTRGHDRTYFLLGVSHINGVFMAVGSAGAIYTSANGSSWTKVNSGTTSEMAGCAYGNGKYVAVGASGTIRTSIDTVNWTGMTYGTGYPLKSVTFGNEKFVAVGSDGKGYAKILSSTNGSDWLEMEVPENLRRLEAVLYASPLFVAVGIYGSITTSSDGITWTKQTAGATKNLKGITQGAGLWVAVGGEITFKAEETFLYGPSVQTSQNGSQWTERVIGSTDWLKTVTYGNGTFVAAGGEIVSSPNGINWTLRRSNWYESFSGSAYGNGRFVLVGEGQDDP